MGYSIRTHAVFDMILVALTLAAPWLFNYSHLTEATLYSIAVALVGVLVNGITSYPLGFWRKLPFRWHRVIEFTSVGPFIVVPWAYYADSGAMPYVISAVGVAVVVNAALVVEHAPGRAAAGAAKI